MCYSTGNRLVDCEKKRMVIHMAKKKGKKKKEKK